MGMGPLYICPSCGHEGVFWYRKGKHIACVKCDVALDSAPQEDWAPETTVFWKRPDGTFTLPAQRDARMPPEYLRVEAQDTHEKRRIVAAIQREETEKAERIFIGKQRMHEQGESERRSVLRDRMASMSPRMRDFARYAMDQNNKKPMRRQNPAFYLQALEFDSSNREPYRGPNGRDKGRK